MRLKPLQRRNETSSYKDGRSETGPENSGCVSSRPEENGGLANSLLNRTTIVRKKFQEGIGDYTDPGTHTGG